jgi:hypothetical protein
LLSEIGRKAPDKSCLQRVHEARLRQRSPSHASQLAGPIGVLDMLKRLSSGDQRWNSQEIHVCAVGRELINQCTPGLMLNWSMGGYECKIRAIKFSSSD